MPFNAQRFLGDNGIPFWTTGKNVSHGWTSVQCPFCSDHSNHGAFPPTGFGYTCFRCGKHRVLDYIQEVLNLPYDDSLQLFKQYSSDLQYIEQYTPKRAVKVHWSINTEKELPSIHAQYLKSRNYNIRHIREQFNVRAEYQTGFFKYRLVIPVYMNHKLVTFVGRDVTGNSPLRYKNYPEELSVLPAKECVYNIDNIGDTAIIFEGIFDAWRFQYNSVALFGIVFTEQQVSLLASKLKRAIICFDAEPQAQEQAEHLGFELAMQGVDTELLVISKGDAGDMTPAQAEEVKQHLFGIV